MTNGEAGSYKYLIIGGGMTADAAARGIRELDDSGSIGMISAESDPPYGRPPLSKGLWKGENLDSVWKKTAEAKVDMHLGQRATNVNLRDKKVFDASGAQYSFEKLLFATGGTPQHLPFGGDDVIYFRTLEDYRHLRSLADQGKSFVVIGGGFIGSEITAALAMQGCKVTMIFPEDGVSARIFPADLALHLVGYFREKGVDVRQGESVADIRKDGDRMMASAKSGPRFTADAVVAGIGIVPNTELAKVAGLDVDDGILVNEQLQASEADVFAAGDVARFKAAALGKRMRVEHEDNALTMGRAAGRAMAGDHTPYEHLPFFYSDLFDLGYEAVGEMDPRHEIVADWREKFREGVIYYVSGGRVRGVLLWGIFGKVDEARALIAEAGPFGEMDLVGRIKP